MSETYFLIRRVEDFDTLREIYISSEGYLKRAKTLEKFEDGYAIQSLTTKFSKSIQVDNEEDIESIVLKETPECKDFPENRSEYRVVPATRKPGVHYDRIFRPVLSTNWEQPNSRSLLAKRFNNSFRRHIDYQPQNARNRTASMMQLSVLTNDLHTIFRYIEPTKSNMEVFSHQIRNLLIIASTEVEAQFQGILHSHGEPAEKVLRTNDYVKLLPILRLNEYSISFGHYPYLDRVCPFDSWDKTKPTQSLFWYDRYNKAKHNREQMFPIATLRSAMEAVCALAIVLYAQYGDGLSSWDDIIGGAIYISDKPEWSLLDCYIPPFHDTEWTGMAIDF